MSRTSLTRQQLRPLAGSSMITSIVHKYGVDASQEVRSEPFRPGPGCQSPPYKGRVAVRSIVAGVAFTTLDGGGAMKVLVLGAGFGGLELTATLADELGDGVDVTLVDRGEGFIFGFSKLDVMFGRRTADSVVHRYADIVKPGVRFVQSTIRSIDPEARRIETDAGVFDGDVMVVALGADLHPAMTPGLLEAGHEFYTVPGAFAAGGPAVSTDRSNRSRRRVCTSVVAGDYAHAEGQHQHRRESDDEVPSGQLSPFEALQDQAAGRLHDVGDGVDRCGDLHRSGEEGAGHEVRGQEQQREEDQAAGLGGGGAAGLEGDESA